MRMTEAVAKRIDALCRERMTTVNEVTKAAGMNSATIYSIFKGRSQNPSLITIQLICEGFGITVRAFFDDPLFDNLELPEDK